MINNNPYIQSQRPKQRIYTDPNLNPNLNLNLNLSHGHGHMHPNQSQNQLSQPSHHRTQSLENIPLHFQQVVYNQVRNANGGVNGNIAMKRSTIGMNYPINMNMNVSMPMNAHVVPVQEHHYRQMYTPSPMPPTLTSRKSNQLPSTSSSNNNTPIGLTKQNSQVQLGMTSPRGEIGAGFEREKQKEKENGNDRKDSKNKTKRDRVNSVDLKSKQKQQIPTIPQFQLSQQYKQLNQKLSNLTAQLTQTQKRVSQLQKSPSLSKSLSALSKNHELFSSTEYQYQNENENQDNINININTNTNSRKQQKNGLYEKFVDRYNTQWMENIKKLREDIGNVREEVRNCVRDGQDNNSKHNKENKQNKDAGKDKNSLVQNLDSIMQINTNNWNQCKKKQQQLSSMMKKQIENVRLQFEQKIKKNHDSLTSVIARVQRQIYNKPASPAIPEYKSSGIKCSGTAILLHYLQQFKIPKIPQSSPPCSVSALQSQSSSPPTQPPASSTSTSSSPSVSSSSPSPPQPQSSSSQKQHAIAIHSMVYYIDNDGYLLDSQQCYIVDGKGLHVRLAERQITLLRDSGIL